MNYLARPLLLFFGLLLPFFGMTQKPHLEKTLLWRISGNGLKKPSYLFGTIHLTDERVFNFEDSVYHALESTEGLAIEVNPDEMVAAMINKELDDKKNEIKIKDVLGDEDYRRYASLIKKKFGKPADEVTVQEVARKKNNWMQTYLQKGEMPTFVDAYLYSVAKKQGKWLGGIEDFADQASLMEGLLDNYDIISTIDAEDNKSIQKNLAKENKKGIEQMIRMYSDRNLEGIEQFSNVGMSVQKKDMLLINRNVKMAMRMDSLSHVRTMFLAVGAAHLPGDSGVIALLRRRGFTVDPVMGNQKISAKKYTFKEVNVPWTEVQDDQKLYKVSMPGPPTTLTPYGMLEMKFYFDISDFTAYYTMAVTAPTKMIDSDSTFYALANKMFNPKKKLTAIPVHVGNIQGREFFATIDRYPVRVQLYIQDHFVYIIAAGNMKNNNNSDTTIRRFFNSFQPVVWDSKKESAEHYLFSDSIMGVQFSSPVKLSLNKSLSDTSSSTWKISTWNGTDLKTGSVVMLVEKEVKPGSYIVSDSLLYGDYRAIINKRYEHAIIEERLIGGKKSYMSSGRGSIDKYYMRSLSTVQEGKVLILFLIGDSTAIYNQSVSQVINTFRLIPHSALNWKYYSDSSNSFTVWSPSPIVKYSEASENFSHFISYDTTTATTYNVILDTLNRFVWGRSDTSFLRNYLRHEFDGDSIITTSALQQGTMGGITYLIKMKNAINVYKRVAYWLNGHQLYKQSVYGSSDLLKNENVNHFFSTFKVKNVAQDLLSLSKPETLFNSLSSSDSIVRIEAYQSLHKIPFTKDDLPILHAHLFKNYLPLYSGYDENHINLSISQQIATLADSTSIEFVKNKYNQLNQNDTTGRELAIVTLARMQTQESFQTMISLMEKKHLLAAPKYSLISTLRDSLTLTAQIFPRMLSLARDTVMIPLLVDLSVRLIDSGHIQMNQIMPYRSLFEAAAHKFESIAPTMANNETDYEWYQMADLLGRWNSEEDAKNLTKYLTSSDIHFRNYVVRKLLESKHSVPSTYIQTLAMNVVSRSNLYSNLKDVKRLDLFPKDYLNQQSLAESAIYDIAAEESGEDTSMLPKVSFIQRRTATYKSRTYTFYLFKVILPGEEESTSTYLGVAGGYKTQMDTDVNLTGIYWADQLTKTNMNDLFEMYLDDLNKAQDEDE